MAANFTKYIFIFLLYTYVNCLVPGLMNRGRGGTVPVQMDMVSDDAITICTGNKRSLGCREGANIAITNVFWGRLSDKICPSDDGDPIVDCDAAGDSLGLVKAQCEGKRECSLTAKHNLLQKEHSSHCPGVNKYLVVKFTCVPESKGILLCDSAETEIACEAGWTMQLADVFWGRRASARTCGLNGGFECDASETATNYLKNKCNGQRHCLVQNDAVVLDPTKHSSCGDAMEKYLMLNYVCSPSESSKDETTDESEVKPKKAVEETKVEAKPKSVASLQPLNMAAAAIVAKPSPVSASALLTNTTGGSSATSAGTANSAFPSSSNDNAATTSKKIPTVSSAKNEKSEEEEDEVQKKSTPSTTPTKEGSSNTNAESDSVDTASVRSILSRAKNILKTLDIGGGSRKKRFRIARPDQASASPRSFNKQQPQQKQQQMVKKMVIASLKNNKQPFVANQQQMTEYPDNFILKSWYGK